MEFNKQSYSTFFGTIEYCYFKKEENYPNGLFIFMGSYIYKQYREEGHFKKMLKHLLNEFPEETLIQVPVENKNLIPMFERLGLKEVERIEYWEKLSNAITMQGVLDKSKLDLV